MYEPPKVTDLTPEEGRRLMDEAEAMRLRVQLETAAYELAYHEHADEGDLTSMVEDAYANAMEQRGIDEGSEKGGV